MRINLPKSYIITFGFNFLEPKDAIEQMISDETCRTDVRFRRNFRDPSLTDVALLEGHASFTVAKARDKH